MTDETQLQTPSQLPDVDATRTAGPPMPVGGPALAPQGYQLDAELGRGGMGVVYKAVQVGLNRTVALKTILSGEHATSKDVIRFLAEAEAVAAVRHPHVVQVFECGEHAGRPFLAMEYCPGGSLADRIKSGRLPMVEAVRLAEGIARGVAAAHEQGIVHRDLKPANVLLGPAGEPKVSDFGLAKRGTADLTRTGAVMGTPQYMAPEQAAGKTKFVGPQADVYALGAMLYEFLAGRPPLTASDPMSLLMKVVEETPPAVRDFAPGVPRLLEAIVRKCLAKDPADRYPTAAELATDLKRWQDGDTPLAASGGSLFGGLRSALARGRQAEEFAAYAGIFGWLAILMIAVETVVYLAVARHIPPWLSVAAHYARLIAFGVIVAYYRRGRLLPRTPPERALWSLWCGYALSCLAAGMCMRIKYGWELIEENQVYPTWGVLSALAFFSLGAGFWGWFYAFGLAFLAAAAVMAADVTAAPLVFGGLWAVVLVTFSRYLRRAAETAV